MRAHIEEAARVCAMELVMARVAPLCPARVIPLVRCLIDINSDGMSVECAARLLGVSRRTLLRNCSASHVVPPAELLAWCRLILAEHLLLHTNGTVEALAFETGFPSGTALRNALRRHADVSATRIRDGSGATPVLDRFRATIRNMRADT